MPVYARVSVSVCVCVSVCLCVSVCVSVCVCVSLSLREQETLRHPLPIVCAMTLFVRLSAGATVPNLPYSDGATLCNVLNPSDCVQVQGGNASLGISDGQCLFVPASVCVCGCLHFLFCQPQAPTHTHTHTQSLSLSLSFTHTLQACQRCMCQQAPTTSWRTQSKACISNLPENTMSAHRDCSLCCCVDFVFMKTHS